MTACDDKLLIESALSVTRGQQSALGFINSPYLFSNGIFYRPVVNASVLLTIEAPGNNLYLHYAVNILIHSLSVIVLYFLFIRLKSTSFQSLMLSLIFAVHPVFVNSVSWLPGRNDSLLALFVISSFLALIRFSETGKMMYLVFHAIGFLAALFSKETAAVAILIFPAYMFLFQKSCFNKKVLLVVLLWLVSLVAWYFARRAVISYELTYDLLKNVPYILQAIGKITLPVALSVLPVVENTTFVYGIFSVIVLAILFWYSDKINSRLMLFGLFWFVLFLLPGLININPEYSRDIMIESRLYLPSIGIFIFISQTELVKKLHWNNKYLIGFYVAVIALFSYSNLVYSDNYKDNFSFWNNAVQNSVSLDLAQSGMGLYYLQSGDYSSAAEFYNKAIELNQNNTDYYRKSAFCLTRLNRIDEAALHYEKVKSREPGDFDANLVLGIITFKKNNFIDAEKLFLKAESLNNVDLQPKIYLMRLYKALGNTLKAEQYESTLKARGYSEPN